MASRLYVVSSRLTEPYMDLLDCAVHVEATPRGRFLTDALTDWASGVGPGYSRAVACWREWLMEKKKPRHMALKLFCEQWVAKNPAPEPSIK